MVCSAHWFTILLCEPIMEMFNLDGVFSEYHKVRYIGLYEMLNQTYSSNVFSLNLRKYELANNLNGFLTNCSITYYTNQKLLQNLYRVNSKLIEELVFLYKFDLIVKYVEMFTEDPIVKAKVKLIGSR